MKTIMFGNGLNMLTDGYMSWSDMVSVIKINAKEDRIPFTLQYEAKIIDSNKSYLNANQEVLFKLKDVLRGYQTNQVYKALGEIRAEHYITTNYDYAMKKTFVSLGYKKPTKVGRDKYSIRRKHLFTKSGLNTSIWHIHGEIDAITSIMLGLGYYGAKISRMKDYIDGKYSYKSGNSNITIGPLKTRLLEGILKPESWIDLFFISDVHILGSGLYYDEIDLWWLLTKRKELLASIKMKVEPNKIIYYGNVEQGKLELFHKLGIDVVEYDCYPKTKESYVRMYNYFIERIIRGK